MYVQVEGWAETERQEMSEISFAEHKMLSRTKYEHVLSMHHNGQIDPLFERWDFIVTKSTPVSVMMIWMLEEETKRVQEESTRDWKPAEEHDSSLLNVSDEDPRKEDDFFLGDTLSPTRQRFCGVCEDVHE